MITSTPEIGRESSLFRMVARVQEEAHVVRSCPPTPKWGCKQKWDSAEGAWVYISKGIDNSRETLKRKRQSDEEEMATRQVRQIYEKDGVLLIKA